MGRSGTARFLGRIWFRALRCEGPALPSGSCLILLNHPNGLLDPLAAAALLDRRVGWLAKATLWKILPLRPFLSAFRAIPVTRPKDGGATRETILGSFRKVHEVLARGDSVAMFPEGVSHTEADLAPLKTGAARMALTSPVPLALVPAGLVYGDRGTFRHSVLLRLGTPIPFEDLAGQGTSHETVAALTARIRAALQPLTLHEADARCLALAQEVAWLLAEAPGARVDLEALRQRVRALVPRLAALSLGDLSALEGRVHEAQAWLRSKGLRPDQVGHPYPAAEIRRWLPGAALRLATAALLLPPSLLFWAPYRLTGWLAGRFTDEGDQTATLKLLGGAVLFPAWAFLLAGGAGVVWGWRMGLLPLALLLAVGLGLPILERAAEDLQAIRGFLRRRDPAVPELIEARRQLLEAFPDLAR
ncbi:MAG: 1-acyl-sn-glycerol-3-phosphate acyltransferase [Geothrix sp.]|uniref:1-acyl-sn-glycerol-3-phosphate acyltransferase n=1 Tax=Geothrix sp. TaxID=1962974 RepID=UPI003BB2208E